MTGRGRPRRGGGGGKGSGPKGPRPSGRSLKVRVATAGRRSSASTRWLERQLNDPYVHEARKLGLRSRAAFKLLQLDDRFHFLKSGGRVVDLGAAPGGWSQVAASRVLRGDKGKVIAIDLLPIDPIPGVHLIHMDFMADAAPKALMGALGGEADVVMSDMAADATGHAATDHLKIVALAEAALDFAGKVLAPGGVFLAKVLQGGATGELLKALKRDFAQVRHVKPPASRADSAEIYVIALGFRGSAQGAE
jgi:23S rRNA (uridine2552-2'-O)-methyltransferase